MQNWIEVLLVSMMPISELRGGIPLGLMLGLSPIEAYIAGVVGSFIPVPFLLLFLDKISKIAERWWLTEKLYSKIVERTERRKDIIEKYGYIGLILFVAVPLPMTGVWTGSLLATLMRLNLLKSAFSIFIGTAIAGIIVTTATLAGINLALGV